MTQSAISGPFGTYADLDALPVSVFGAPPGPVPDPNTDAGPSFFYQGTYIPDPRFIYPKDQVTGRRGVVAGFASTPLLKSVGQIPAAVAANNIAAAQNVVSGTPMTFAAASVGVTVNIPIVPFNNSLNSQAPVTAALALDFGFAFGNCTAANSTILVADSTNFFVGMPLVIGGVGNGAGTLPLLTQVASVVDATHITVTIVPVATFATAPISTGNLWSVGGTNASGQPLTPTAAMPYLAAGPGFLLDSAQAVTRGVQILGVTAGAGGTFTVRGWDLYNVPMSETITVGAGAVTGWGKKTYKYLASVTPNFTDAHNYSVGTSDVFGFALATTLWENTEIFWAAAAVTGAPTGFVAGVATAASATTGDVRGTVQTSANGGGTGIGTTASNGTVSGLAMSGNRIELFSRPTLRQMIYSTQANPARLLGPTQA